MNFNGHDRNRIVVALNNFYEGLYKLRAADWRLKYLPNNEQEAQKFISEARDVHFRTGVALGDLLRLFKPTKRTQKYHDDYKVFESRLREDFKRSSSNLTRMADERYNTTFS